MSNLKFPGYLSTCSGRTLFWRCQRWTCMLPSAASFSSLSAGNLSSLANDGSWQIWSFEVDVFEIISPSTPRRRHRRWQQGYLFQQWKQTSILKIFWKKCRFMISRTAKSRFSKKHHLIRDESYHPSAQRVVWMWSTWMAVRVQRTLLGISPASK